MIGEQLLNGNCAQRKDNITERIVLELISFNTVENDSAGSHFAFCRISWIGLRIKLDLTSLAVHLVRHQKIVMERWEHDRTQ
jgi:hypothetical protein